VSEIGIKAAKPDAQRNEAGSSQPNIQNIAQDILSRG